MAPRRTEIEWESHYNGLLFTYCTELQGLRVAASIHYAPVAAGDKWKVEVYFNEDLRWVFREEDLQQARSRTESIILAEVKTHKTLSSMIHGQGASCGE